MVNLQSEQWTSDGKWVLKSGKQERHSRQRDRSSACLELRGGDADAAETGSGRAVSCVGGHGDGTCPGSGQTAVVPDSPPVFLKALPVWAKAGQHEPPERRRPKEQRYALATLRDTPADMLTDLTGSR